MLPGATSRVMEKIRALQRRLSPDVRVKHRSAPVPGRSSVGKSTVAGNCQDHGEVLPLGARGRARSSTLHPFLESAKWG